MIVVTGATGNVGREVVRHLVEAGERVRALTRNPGSVPFGAEYVDAFFSFYSEGKFDEATVFPTVEEVTGHPPRTFAQWARANAERFQ